MYFILIVYRRTTTVVWGGANRSIKRGLRELLQGEGASASPPPPPPLQRERKSELKYTSNLSKCCLHKMLWSFLGPYCQILSRNVKKAYVGFKLLGLVWTDRFSENNNILNFLSVYCSTTTCSS